MNNLIGAFGAVGAITATRPVEMLLHIAEWRDIFAGLAVVTVLVSISVLLLVPEKKITTSSQETFASQMAGYKDIFREPFFWRVTLMYAFGYTALVSYQTLWADPWLRDVAGLGQTARANCLLSIQIGFLIGLLLTGFCADVLRGTRVQALQVFSGGVLLFIGVQVLLACGVTEGVTVIWGLFGFLSSSVFLSVSFFLFSFSALIKISSFQFRDIQFVVPDGLIAKKPKDRKVCHNAQSCPQISKKIQLPIGLNKAGCG